MSDPTDVAQNIFLNDEGELRSGWRVLAFVILFILAASLLSGFTLALVTLFPSLGFLRSGGPTALDNLDLISHYVAQLINFAAALLASWACARLLERRGLASVGYKPHRGWLRDFSLGSVIG